METVETIAPISIENLKKYFANKDTFYIIDYKKSELQDVKLLTYLSNLDLPVDIKDPNLELVKEYLNSISLVNISSLENIVIDILIEYKGLSKNSKYKQFIEENKHIISKWSDKLDSLSIFNVYIINSEELRNYAKGFPKDNSNDLIGVNFISLLKHERFYYFYNKLNNNIKFYTHYFDDYMFRGKNLYSYWSNSNNPMFLLTMAIAEGKHKEYLKAKEQDKEFVKNATSF